MAHSSSTTLASRLNWLVFLVVIAAAIAPGVTALSGVHLPYDDDGFRDLAFAQSLRDGRWFADPFYADERAWYNPAVPGVVALVSGVLGTPIPETLLRLGPWLNSIGLVTYFVLVRRLIGEAPALFALVAFVLFPGRVPAWASGTYSPWLFPAIAAQALLYLTLRLWIAVLDAPGHKRSLAAGLALGATFLTHTAAAVFVTGLITLTASAQVFWASEIPAHRRVRHLLTVGAVALAVMGPFFVPLLTTYGFQTLNRLPATWRYDDLQLSVHALLGEPLTQPFRLVFVILGGWVLLRTFQRRESKIIIAATTLCFVLMQYARAVEDSTSLPTIVPAYHFFFVLRAFAWVFLAVGAWECLRRLHRHRPGMSLDWTAVVLTLVVLVAFYPRYLGREAFTEVVDKARAAHSEEADSLRDWIRRNTGPDAVFLSSDEDALRIVGPAGRRVVAVAQYFSNPYVDYVERATARDRMLNLVGSSSAEFEALRARYRVSHALVRGQPSTPIGNLAPAATWPSTGWSIYRLQ